MDDVMVVGAGPTGLVTACALLGQGVPVRVVDRADGPATTSRALILHARGVQVLDRLGALGDLPDRVIRVQGVAVYANGARVAKVALDQARASTPMIVSQAEVEAALRRRLAELGGEIEWNTEVTGATQDEDGVTVGLDDVERTRAGWLVGCDGAHSRVRALARVPFPGVPLGERFLLADVHAKWDADRHTTAAWLHRDGLLLAFPLPGASDLWRLIAGLQPGTDDVPDVTAAFTQIFRDRTGGAGPAIRATEWTSVFRIHRRLAGDYRNGRMLLAGDAAHINSPIGGQGMNIGIADAENLAWRLALVIGGQADSALLDTYRDERRPAAAGALTGTTAVTRLLLGANPIVRTVRDRLASAAGVPAVHRLALDKASQLGLSYRSGPLSPGGVLRRHAPRAWGGRRGRRGLQPGDRVPDRACLRADGSRTRLYAELGRGFVLLGEPDPRVRELLGDRVSVLSPLNGHGHGMLVRPDGHLAYREGLADMLRKGRVR
ncbi:FAD-dependent monooxygenase [Actinomadura barringtoniae]|uniref:FAD-dependent monooxygenase n=1 Tax=Actinomadura barringtoniae TaxID=1427535 RepID=A0A939PGP7_9ACTN|nr:FAD-dependent monooxygenase [Actinomadura barringtoniae]MBO2449429.1 FAD-dependent monooxygenase [Actinomadura barringtoniae]